MAPGRRVEEEVFSQLVIEVALNFSSMMSILIFFNEIYCVLVDSNANSPDGGNEFVRRGNVGRVVFALQNRLFMQFVFRSTINRIVC